MMRIVWMVAIGFLCGTACSGGTDSGPIAGPGPGRKEPPEGSHDGDPDTFDIPGQLPGATVGPGGGSGACFTCTDAYASGTFSPPCSGSGVIMTNVVACASGACGADCTAWIGGATGVDAPCDDCLSFNCTSERDACLAD